MAIADRLNKLLGRAEKTVAEHKEQIEKAIDKAEEAADRKTQGRYHDQIDKGGSKAKTYVQGLESDKQAQDTSIGPPKP